MMDSNQKTRERTDRMVKTICQLLDNQGGSGDSAGWDMGRMEELANTEAWGAAGSTSLEVTQREDPEKWIFAVLRQPDGGPWEEKQERAALEGLAALIQTVFREESAAGGSVVRVVFFTNRMRLRVRLEQAFGPQTAREMRQEAKKANALSKQPRLEFLYVLAQEFRERRTVRLKGVVRHNTHLEPPVLCAVNRESVEAREVKTGLSIQSQVFTTQLWRLAEIYDQVGDLLFQGNVRLGIPDVLDVDRSIHRTLETEPELFWNKNNGVTILVRSPEDPLQGSEEIVLGETGPERDPAFSVINGAQTITAFARFYFDLEVRKGEDKALADKLDRVKEAAKVMVRVMHIRTPKGEEWSAQALRLEKEISVALNRQKPIQIEDIAYINPAVHKLIQVLEGLGEADGAAFRLVRHGEESGGRDLRLDDFARARMACAGMPGTARSKGKKQLLKLRELESGEEVFQQKELFASDWLEAGNPEPVFRRDYGAVWFASRLYRAYGELARTYSHGDSQLETAVRNGGWYFTAAAVQILNGFSRRGKNRPDFTRFQGDADRLRPVLPEAAECFGRLALLYTETAEEIRETGSNFFKSDRHFEGLAAALYNNSLGFPGQGRELEFQGLRERLYRLLGRDSNSAARFETVLPEAVSAMAPPPPDYVVLGGRVKPVKTGAEALAAMVEYVMYKTAIPLKTVLAPCASWLVSGAPASELGYFRNTLSIDALGISWTVGTSSSNAEKRGQIKRLCHEAHMEPGQVKWYRSGRLYFSS